MRKILMFSLCVIVGFSYMTSVQAQQAPPSKSLINKSVIKNIREFIDSDTVRLSIKNQNMKYANFSQADIDKLDSQWRKERKISDQPLISATLSNPLSSYLTKVQARSQGLYSEIFVMDDKGLNIGQSNISSDYWQGDEAKFQKTYPKGPKAVFIGEPEYNKDLAVWLVQVNLSVAGDDQSKSIGAATIEVNLSELLRRKNMGVL